MSSRLYSRPTDALRNLLELLKSGYDWRVFLDELVPDHIYPPYLMIEQIGGAGYGADTTIIGNFKNVILLHLFCSISDNNPILDYVDQIYTILSTMGDNNMNPPNAINYQYIDVANGVTHWQFTLEFTG